ncbi:hypothetical protein QBC32DRAFT_363673 [Pseudoneurospora amorphoporcata]|uniref:Uncharacterized protein n=1 Tax=Pseudoneurospora amorphoporcata TaxID=241081 RepID=A0AAN6NQG2_9PEZI|nr:hypothetical protein QBC32DRAFT_363673 [Pseudoneurospora amorphoporcata]
MLYRFGLGVGVHTSTPTRDRRCPGDAKREAVCVGASPDGSTRRFGLTIRGGTFEISFTIARGEEGGSGRGRRRERAGWGKMDHGPRRWMEVDGSRLDPESARCLYLASCTFGLAIFSGSIFLHAAADLKHFGKSLHEQKLHLTG